MIICIVRTKIKACSKVGANAETMSSIDRSHKTTHTLDEEKKMETKKKQKSQNEDNPSSSVHCSSQFMSCVGCRSRKVFSKIPDLKSEKEEYEQGVC